MSMRRFTYRHKPNHRVSAASFLRLRLRAGANSVLDARIRPIGASGRFCFVVGCGHSGTTLLASKLGLHDDVLLVPRESNVFLPHESLRRARAETLDWLGAADRERRAIVIEKSPKHVHSTGRIRRLLPQARIIVIVRNPLDTCASLYRRYGDLDLAIERWCMDNAAAAVVSNEPGTMLIRYEHLTREPHRILAEACAFLGIPWDPGLLDRSGSLYGSDPGLRPNMAIRHEQVSQPIRDNNGRSRDVLDDEQTRRVRERTANVAALLGYVEPNVRRLQGNPMIRPEMLPGRDGENINGPSLVRVPAWVAAPLGRYYLYFAHHKGRYIRLAYADSLHGPWHIHAPGVLDLRQVAACHDHIASPDVVIDEESRQFRLYFHGHASAGTGQKSFLALSADGLQFTAREAALGEPYFRVFRHDAHWYAMAKGGALFRSADGLSNFEAGPNPFPDAAARDASMKSAGPRHVAVLRDADVLWVYYTSIGDAPERVLRGRINLAGDWHRWTVADCEELLRPRFSWEGADLPVQASRHGRARRPAHELRDPAVFVDDDGRRYLVYSVMGERGLAIAELIDAAPTPAATGLVKLPPDIDG